MALLRPQAVDTRLIRKRDWQIISLVGAAHACSHFFQLLLPTLFLSLSAEFGFDFVQLGFLASMFFLVSGIGQASSGFVVDRIGPVPVLLFGLSCFIASAVLIGLSSGYGVLLVAAVIGGIGNAIFHPVDYSIINHRVSHQRLGHAFSTHGLTGNLGWAFAPVFIATLTFWFNWRVAAFGVAAVVAAVLCAMWLGRKHLSGQGMSAKSDSSRVPVGTRDDVRGVTQEDARAESFEKATTDQPGPQPSVLVMLQTLLRQPALWGAFLFFACTSLAWSAVQQYTIPLFAGVHGLDKVTASTAISGYMILSALGMLAGGFLVNASMRSERVLLISLLAAGALLVLLTFDGLQTWLAMSFLVLAGFASGISAPSRDMLIRRVTPKGATGSVYGLVYSGMDVGSSMGPVVFGLLVDHGWQDGPWVGAGLAFAVAAWLAIMVSRSSAAQRMHSIKG